MATQEGPQSQDQKKRTLEALERRFAVAKAELLHQKPRINPSIFGAETGPQRIGSSAVSSSSSSSSSIKKDVESTDPTYVLLSQPMHDNLLVRNVEINSRKGTGIDKVLHELLQKGDFSQKYMQGSRTKKIDDVILLENFVPKRGTITGSRIRALRSHSKRSKLHMSMKQHKKRGSLDLPQGVRKFSIFKPMHEMWKGYIMELVKISGKNQLVQCLLTADLHGAVIQVAECKVTSFAGTTGIMIRETAETFGIITEDDRFHRLLGISITSVTEDGRIDFYRKFSTKN